MIVKWVCSVCGSNNLQDAAPVMQCEVCGNIRTSEPSVRVDAHVIDTSRVEKSKIDLTREKSSYTQILTLLAFRCGSIMVMLLRALILLAFVFTGVAIWRSQGSVSAFTARLAGNSALLLSPERLLFHWENTVSLLRPSCAYMARMVAQNLKTLFTLSPDSSQQTAGFLSGIRAFLTYGPDNIGLLWDNLAALLRHLLTGKPSGILFPTGDGGLLRKTQEVFWDNAGRNWGLWLDGLQEQLAALPVNLHAFRTQAGVKLTELLYDIIQKVRGFL